MTFKVGKIGVWLCLFVMSMPLAALAKDDIVAKADGFVVYRHDIDVLKDAYDKSGFETNSGEYVNAMLKIRLFAEEALSRNMVKPSVAAAAEILSDKQDMTEERLRNLLEVYREYVAYLYSSFPVSDAAILSYYLAFPEKFPADKSANSEGDFFRSDKLTNELKTTIRERLIENRKPGIIANEFKRLREKYHVKLLSGY